MSKKAEESTTPEAPNRAIYFIIAAAIISIFAVFLVIATSSYQVETTSIIGNLENVVLEYRLLNSPECFAYQDKTTKRVYPHVIDAEKFTNERALECIHTYSGLCFEAILDPDGKLVSMMTDIGYENFAFSNAIRVGNLKYGGRDIKVNIWPITLKDKGNEMQSFMVIRTSSGC